MPNINRREFSQLALALGASVRSFGGAVSIDDTLRGGMERRKIPAVTPWPRPTENQQGGQRATALPE
jgi:hypothetical protein